MRLSSSTSGEYVELAPVRYQFDDVVGDDDDDNWLVIRGAVQSVEFGEWVFEDPALLVTESRELGEWLRGAARRDDPSAGDHPDGPARPHTGFIEPNIGMALVDFSAGTATIRVFFSHESAPPDLRADSVRTGATAYLDLTIGASDLNAAADVWDSDVDRFPSR